MATAACTHAEPSETAPVEQPTPATPTVQATVQADVQEVLAVWEQGAQAIPAAPPTPLPQAEDGELHFEVSWPPKLEEPFTTFDDVVASFLRHPSVYPAVQFSCGVSVKPIEEWLTKALDAQQPIVRLRALTVLVRVQAPRTVAEQWQTLQELRAGPDAAAFAAVTDALLTAFSPASIAAKIADQTVFGMFAGSRHRQWCLRVAGVCNHTEFLPDLTRWSKSRSIDYSLAAVRSLQDMQGPAVNQALAECVRGWRYTAAGHAAHTLLQRQPELLRTTLLELEPGDRAYGKGLLLAKLEDHRAVPILCQTVPEIAIKDSEMFDAIERLARTEHLVAIAALPNRVRDEQKTRAMEVVAAVRKRLKE